jgi:hypothetical protein
MYGFDGSIQVCNFDQTATAQDGSLRSGRVGVQRVCHVETGEFWQYAKEAILSVSYAKTDDERQVLFDLARTWTQAALIERHAQLDTGNTIDGAA